MRDLEIRGSGNILGTEQSGYLNSIGFDLYCKMLRNEVDRMQNKPRRFLPEAEINFDFLTPGIRDDGGKMVCGFPPSYIENETLRIGAYRKLAVQDSEQSLNELHEEFVDRFGKINAIYSIEDKDYFSVKVSVAVSDQFFAWLCGFGNSVKIEAPQSVKTKFKEYLDKMRKLYY
jgi:transcription-repair coupling factor (superfamily II helicase)